MLRAILCCVLIAATATMAWVQLDNVPVTNGEGTRITGGRLADNDWHYWVYGVFPYGSQTHYGWARVDQTTPQWNIDYGAPFPYLEWTSATFQRQGNGVFFFSGYAPSNQTGKLYMDDLRYFWYPTSVNLPITPGDGSCITYVPYGNTPGWVYYLSKSNGGQFWRYSLISSDNVVVDGICPGEGTITGNSTPLFQWDSAATTQYRLQVATDSSFCSTIIDVTGSDPQYQVTTALDNASYYWRTGTPDPNGPGWCWNGPHKFIVDYGWIQLTGLTDNSGGVGASMAYKGSFGNSGHASILLLVGGGSTHFWEYNLTSGEWNQLTSSPAAYPQYEGTSLTTQDATGVTDGRYAWASFGGQQSGEDFPWFYSPFSNSWYVWNTRDSRPYYDPQYLENVTAEASMVFCEQHVQYMVTGSCEFFRVDPPSDEVLQAAEQMANVTGPARTQAHAVSRYCGVEVEYQLSKATHVRATLHDALGRRVGVLDAGEQKPGLHRLSWNTDRVAQKLSAGAYFVLLDMGAEKARLKAVIR
ncbi:MAG TPA: hypothetical protein VMH22_10065 [bacterium]|nr:hypothetical protein [bacterium]